MWHKVDPDGLDKDQLLKLYELVEGRERAYRDDLFRFTNFYSAISFAILGVTLSGLVTLHEKGSILTVLCLGPIITAIVSYLAISATKRIYRRVLEEISVKAKIENALGLDGGLSIQSFSGKETIWKEDKYLLPPRHAKKRTDTDSSQDFIDKTATGGVYRENKFYFGLIIVISCLLCFAIIMLSLK